MKEKKDAHTEKHQAEEPQSPDSGDPDMVTIEIETPHARPENDPSMTEETEADQTGTDTEQEETEELPEKQRLRSRVAELEDRLLRTAAEFDNYRKRVARQYEEMVRSANDKILTEFMEIIDNFERALRHGNEKTDLDAYRKGAELILTQMTNLLKKYDIEPIEAVGRPFDPNLHEAMMQVDTDEYDEGVVAMEISKGYRQGNRVLRHSKVGVSKGK